MREILEAILNDASGPELQALPLPETFRAATVHKEDVELFAGMLSE
jgi:crotonyl-CoA reductase